MKLQRCGLYLLGTLLYNLSIAGTMGAIETPNRFDIYGSLLFLQPNSDNLRYATFVKGQQPYFQNWHYQEINPNFSPTFEVGVNYHFLSKPSFGVNLDWLHINTNDSSYKQANTALDTQNIQFVGPPFEMSPPVFGIKHVNAEVNFAFDSILINANKTVDFAPDIKAVFFAGANILRVNQQLTTTFSDIPGALPTPYSYALAPDPLYSMQLINESKYLGAGPNAGVTASYEIKNGFGILGQALGSLTVGTIRTSDQFYGSSSRLKALGFGQTHQHITSPTAVQVVPGVDGKVGVFYNYQNDKIPKLTIELGYRIADYLNAITTVSPQTLVQPGSDNTIPEFATGTMAIVSTDARTRPFIFNGPYLNLSVAIA